LTNFFRFILYHQFSALHVFFAGALPVFALVLGHPYLVVLTRLRLCLGQAFVLPGVYADIIRSMIAVDIARVGLDAETPMGLVHA
jgi:hypothetical protein